MIKIIKYKWIHISVLVFFISFIFQNACFAKENYPRIVKIKVKLDATVKVKRIKKNIVPLQIKLKNKTYKIKKQHGKYGFKLKARDMVAISPEFKDKLGTSISAIGLYRIQTLIKKDKKKAAEVIKFHKALKIKKASIDSLPGHDMTQQLKAVLNAISDLFIGNAHADDSPVMLASAKAAVDQKFMGQMNKGYNKMLNSQSFVYPIVQPGIGGWDLLNENEQGGGGSSDDEHDTGGDQEEEETWYDKLLGAFLMIVVMIAPIAAIVFLCTNPLTLASVLMSLAIANGAVTGASIITTTLGTIGDLLSGNPIYEVTDVTTFSSDSAFGVIDNSTSWP